MKRLICGFIAIIFLIALFVYIGTTYSNAEKTLKSYQRNAPFSEYEMTYYNIGSSLFGKGIVFYRPQFPTLPFKISIDRLGLVITTNERIIRLSGIKFDIFKTLQKRTHLVSDLKAFQMPQDLVIYPLEGLAILGFDTLKEDIRITILEAGDTCYLTFNVSHAQQDILEFKTFFSTPSDPRLWNWTDSKFQEGQVRIMNPDWLKKLSDYYKGIGSIPPHDLMRALAQKEPWIIDFNLEHPVSFSSLFGEK